MASVLPEANKNSCTKLGTRKCSDWQPSHPPLNLKGVDNRIKPVTFNTFAFSTTASTPFSLTATFHFANHFQSTIVPTHSIMTTLENSKLVEGNALRNPYCHFGPVTQDAKVRECVVMCTLTLTLQFGKSLIRPNNLMIMYGHGSQQQLLSLESIHKVHTLCILLPTSTIWPHGVFK